MDAIRHRTRRPTWQGAIAVLRASLALAALSFAAAAPVVAEGQDARAGGGSAPAAQVVISTVSVTVSANTAVTQVRLAASAPVAPAIGLLDSPYRLVIDVEGATFAQASGQPSGQPSGQRASAGLALGYRYGLLTPGRARVVVDLAGPVRIERVKSQRTDATRRGSAGAPAHEFVIDLLAVPPQAFAPQPLPAAAPAVGPARPALRPSQHDGLPGGLAGGLAGGITGGMADAAAGQRPLVVIDPGHGGVDPGAVGALVTEKSIVLAVAQAVAARLSAGRRVDAVLTRSEDVFVPLDDRARIAEEQSAALFVSIHADAIGDRAAAATVRGASLYVLSDRASDEVARQLAERENAVDALAGVEVGHGAAADGVRAILVDLLRRETTDFSAAAQGVLIEELRRRILMARQPARSAAFRVLRQEQTPAVLIELGYMTNPNDEKQMATREWQQKVADAIAAGIERFIAMRPR